MKKVTLLESNPEIAKQWHESKNGLLKPIEVNSGSNLKVWWKCPKGSDHEWEAVISSRTRGTGCSVCAGRTVVLSNSLTTVSPKLASEWHPTKNGELTPDHVTLASSKKVWWKCHKGEDHEWQSKISNRSSLSQGCSVCENRTVVKSNCLKTTHPEITKEWDYKLNSKKPNEVVSGNHTKFWWKCNKDLSHPSYLASIDKRVQKRGCPKCGELNRRKNKAKPKIGNSLGDISPKLITEWHPTKNGKLTPFDVNPKSHRKIWWKCPKGDDHEWEAVISSRSIIKNGNDVGCGCPICNGKKVVESNCITTTHPHLLKEWHPTKNGKLIPDQVFSGSHQKIWWKCLNNQDHPDWRVGVRNRALKNSGCNYCWPTPQSKEELTISFELKYIFPSIDPAGYNLNSNGKKWATDIFIKELNLIVEYDGKYWHGNKENIDIRKTDDLTRNGYNVIRIRQHPLEKLNPEDITYEGRFKGKYLTDQILKSIVSKYQLKKKAISRINNYLNQTKLQNQSEFHKYISEKLGDKRIKKN